MLLEQIGELVIADVLDRGIPNKECIAIRVESPVNMAQYGLLLGISALHDGMAVPIRDNFFWFGEGFVKKGDWIFIYTGSGTPTNIPSSDKLSDIYTLYWNRQHTLFHNSNIVPTLFRMDGVQVLPTKKALPQ